jgi:membrane-associated protease RseP (regulator of RpoE activity)
VESTSPGAKIYLFGKDTGEKTPFTFCYIPIGSYDVKVVGKDGSKTVEDVVVEPYLDTDCEVDLSKQ